MFLQPNKSLQSIPILKTEPAPGKIADEDNYKLILRNSCCDILEHLSSVSGTIYSSFGAARQDLNPKNRINFEDFSFCFFSLYLASISSPLIGGTLCSG